MTNINGSITTPGMGGNPSKEYPCIKCGKGVSISGLAGRNIMVICEDCNGKKFK